MLWTFNTDQRIKECELRDNPIIIKVNKFDEDSAQEFCTNMSLAHCTGEAEGNTEGGEEEWRPQ